MEHTHNTPRTSTSPAIGKAAAILLALVGTLGLTACDALQGPNDQDNCHINDSYEVQCDVVGDNGSLETP